MSLFNSRTADRGLAIALIGLAAFIASQALSLEVPFSYDPVGPKAFPIGLAIILALLSLVLLIRPGENGEWPSAGVALKLLAVLGLLLIYALLFQRLGYLMSSGLVIAGLARLFSASWLKAVATGVLMAIGSYWLFTLGLGITLPGGSWLG
ncbi:tripartite tricarboxylate transporter TctB family protein [Halomonas cupida]|uniref:Membrane protein n=1 Tax=Halomonas cupida TaxID=44933 RepID=A0A1M7HBG2_9GAMM|nr:tripartite tricarboxylate transporter TctB family protein [Halomonas cupida]GEN26293.1 membrane protein [Halomonas cupida]SHM25760.1 putative tricarboxylic transport membrane protein [Halomonas cupida]